MLGFFCLGKWIERLRKDHDAKMFKQIEEDATKQYRAQLVTDYLERNWKHSDWVATTPVARWVEWSETEPSSQDEERKIEL